jgi:hypothetical protein
LIGIWLAWCVYYILRAFVTSRRHARNAARLGCKPPLTRPYKYPLAIDLAQRVQKADKEKRVPDMFLEVYEELGRPGTWIQHFLGVDNLVTVDPKNIQALLATQFNDFALGISRRRNFIPMLGDGIFTVDGKAWYDMPETMRLKTI